KTIKAAERADLAPEAAEQKDAGLSNESAENLSKWMKDIAKENVNAIRSSRRLVHSPAVAVDQETSMTRSMRQIMRSMRKEGAPEPEHKHDLELNPCHPVIVRLEQIRQTDPELAQKVAEQIYDNARVAAGVLDDPRTMLKRMNDLL